MPRSKAEWPTQSSEAARVFAGYRQLLQTRRAQPAFHPAAPQIVLDLDPGLFALRRGPRDGQTIVAFHNVTGSEVQLAQAALGFDGVTTLRDLLDGNAVHVTGSLAVPAYGVRWLSTETISG